MYSQTTTATAAPKLESIDELHSVLMEMKECIVLDIETTGFSLAQHAEIIEIAAVRMNVESKKILQKFKTFVKPSDAFNVPKKITELTRISWKDVEDAPYIEEILPAFATFIGDLPVVAHNATFDWVRFLVPSFEKVGLHATNRCICSMKLASNVFPGRGRNGYNLEALCGLYGYPIEGHHDALVDTISTAGLFAKLLAEYRQQNSEGKGADSSLYQEGQKPAAPSQIPTVNFDNLIIRRISPYKGASKKAGPSIYVVTNFGKVCYSVRRRVWTCVELWTSNNAPIKTWGRNILRCAGIEDMQAFIEQYKIAS